METGRLIRLNNSPESIFFWIALVVVHAQTDTNMGNDHTATTKKTAMGCKLKIAGHQASHCHKGTRDTEMPPISSRFATSQVTSEAASTFKALAAFSKDLTSLSGIPA